MRNNKIFVSFLALLVAGCARANSEPDFVDDTNHEEDLMKIQAAESVRQSRMDLAAMASSPIAKLALAKGMSMLNSPMLQGLLKSEKVQNLMKPETLKGLLNSDMAKKYMNAESLQNALDSPLAKKIMDNPKVKSMMESDALKGYISKAKEMMPQMMEMAKSKMAEMTAR